MGSAELRRNAGAPPGLGAPWIAALIACGFVCYLGAINSFFLADDFDSIRSVVQGGPFGLWSTRGCAFFRPVASLSFFLDHAVWGLRPIGYHLTNLVLHLVSVVLVARIALMLARLSPMLERNAREVAFFSGLFFAVLATHSEPVVWISGRTDLLACLFSLASLLVYLSARLSGKLKRLPLSLAFLLLALLSKEAAIALPLIIVVLELFFYARSKRKDLRTLRSGALPYVALLILYPLVRYLALGKLIGGYGRRIHTYIDLEVVGKLLFYFPARALVPALGTVSVGGVIVPLSGAVFAAAVVVILLISRVSRERHLPRLVYLMVGICFLSIVPVMNLSVTAGTSEGTRFLYFPSVFLVVTLVLALASVLRKREFVVVCLILAAAHGGLLVRSTRLWRRAGDVSRSVVQDIIDAPAADRLWILNVPDDIRGVYVFRNGVGSARSLFCDEDGPADVVPLRRHVIPLDGGTASAAREGHREYRLRVSDCRALPIASPRVTPAFVEENFEVFEEDACVARFVFRESVIGDRDRVAFYSGGRLHYLDSPKDPGPQDAPVATR